MMFIVHKKHKDVLSPSSGLTLVMFSFQGFAAWAVQRLGYRNFNVEDCFALLAMTVENSMSLWGTYVRKQFDLLIFHRLRPVVAIRGNIHVFMKWYNIRCFRPFGARCCLINK